MRLDFKISFARWKTANAHQHTSGIFNQFLKALSGFAPEKCQHSNVRPIGGNQILTATSNGMQAKSYCCLPDHNVAWLIIPHGLRHAWSAWIQHGSGSLCDVSPGLWPRPKCRSVLR